MYYLWGHILGFVIKYKIMPNLKRALFDRELDILMEEALLKEREEKEPKTI